MIRPTYLAAIALALALVAVQAQHIADYIRVENAWGSCVRQSFEHRQPMANDALAIETAFAACRAEKEAIYDIVPLDQTTEQQVRVDMRAMIESDLLGRR